MSDTSISSSLSLYQGTSLNPPPAHNCQQPNTNEKCDQSQNRSLFLTRSSNSEQLLLYLKMREKKFQHKIEILSEQRLVGRAKGNNNSGLSTRASVFLVASLPGTPLESRSFGHFWCTHFLIPSNSTLKSASDGPKIISKVQLEGH